MGKKSKQKKPVEEPVEPSIEEEEKESIKSELSSVSEDGQLGYLEENGESEMDIDDELAASDDADLPEGMEDEMAED